MIKPLKTTLPKNSQIESLAADSYFQDAWKIQALIPDLDPLQQFIRVAKNTPRWIDFMMTLRNQIVGLFGLKNLGTLSDINPLKRSSDYAIGDRVGIFTIVDRDEHEILLGDKDKHLNVIVSIHKEVSTNSNEAIVTVSTVVHIKNWLGRLYMMPVIPAHHVIANRMTKVIGNAT